MGRLGGEPYRYVAFRNRLTHALGGPFRAGKRCLARFWRGDEILRLSSPFRPVKDPNERSSRDRRGDCSARIEAGAIRGNPRRGLRAIFRGKPESDQGQACQEE
jgi:hypothetical protein